MQFREVYRGFEVTVIDNILVIRDVETEEEGKIDIEKKDKNSISKMAHFVIDKRILEKAAEKRMQEKYQSVQFSLELRSGESYSYSYLVPEKVVKAGKEEIEKYIILEALGDLVCVNIEEVHSDVV